MLLRFSDRVQIRQSGVVGCDFLLLHTFCFFLSFYRVQILHSGVVAFPFFFFTHFLFFCRFIYYFLLCN